MKQPPAPEVGRTPLRAAGGASVVPASRFPLRPAVREGEGQGEVGHFQLSAFNPQLFLTRHELAAVLKISVRTLDRMTAAGELPVRRLRRKTVRFYLPEVLRRLAAGGYDPDRCNEAQPARRHAIR